MKYFANNIAILQITTKKYAIHKNIRISYLEHERIKPLPDETLFSSYKIVEGFMTTTALQAAYRQLNKSLEWEQEEKGRFRKANSHMMRKFFNTQLINAGMPEEIREHFMGHVISNKVQDAYFLADPGVIEGLFEVYGICYN